MKTLFEENYLTCHYDETIPVIAHRWNGFVKGDLFRSGIQRCLGEYTRIKNQSGNQPLHWICNSTDLKVLAPKDSEWVNTEFAEMLLQRRIRRIAMIIAKDVFAQMAVTSFEKAVGTKAGTSNQDVITRFFANEEEAKTWLKFQ